jgi:hypothetical protein
MYHLTDVKLNIDEFRAWLEHHDPTTLVGRGFCTDENPLAKFLAHKAKTPIAHLNLAVYWIPDSGVEATPLWAQKFLELCGAGYHILVPPAPKRPISAREALTILERCH